jgi:broad specificity phosphatase PhoE
VVFLVRHCRTRLNATGVLRGRLDPPLDHVGRREAAGLAALFHPARLAAVAASPLLRAQQTAQAIATATDAPLVTDVGPVDRDYGPWAGVDRADVERRFGSLDAAPTSSLPQRSRPGWPTPSPGSRTPGHRAPWPSLPTTPSTATPSPGSSRALGTPT